MAASQTDVAKAALRSYRGKQRWCAGIPATTLGVQKASAHPSIAYKLLPCLNIVAISCFDVRDHVLSGLRGVEGVARLSSKGHSVASV